MQTTTQATLETLKALAVRYDKALDAAKASVMDSEIYSAVRSDELLEMLGEIDGCMDSETLLRSAKGLESWELHALIISARAVLEPLERGDIETARMFTF